MKVFVGPIIGRGRIEPDWMRSLLRLLRYPVRFEPAYNDSLLCRARSRVAMWFLESNCDVLVSIDSDIAFDAQAVWDMCEQAEEYNIVGGVYVSRSKDVCFPTSGFINNHIYKFGEDPTPQPVRWVAGGCVAYHRRVFETLAERPDMPLLHPGDMKFRPFYMPMISTSQDGVPIYLSEDWAVCERAAEHGYKSYINPAVRLLHLGEYPFRLEDMLTDVLPMQEVWLSREPGGKYARHAPANAGAVPTRVSNGIPAAA